MYYKSDIFNKFIILRTKLLIFIVAVFQLFHLGLSVQLSNIIASLNKIIVSLKNWYQKHICLNSFVVYWRFHQVSVFMHKLCYYFMNFRWNIQDVKGGEYHTKYNNEYHNHQHTMEVTDPPFILSYRTLEMDLWSYTDCINLHIEGG